MCVENALGKVGWSHSQSIVGEIIAYGGSLLFELVLSCVCLIAPTVFFSISQQVSQTQKGKQKN